MFSRLFLVVLSVISLVWIVLVGYDLLDKKEFIAPERIFTAADGEILIVNRSAEVHLEELNFPIHPGIKAVYEKLLLNVYPNEQLYTAAKRPLILVAHSKVWTASSVEAYFALKGLAVDLQEGKNFALANGMVGRYKRNFLVIHPKAVEVKPGEEKEWPLWDTKASASIIQLSNPLKSTNIYFRANGTISYQTKYGPDLTGPKLDDADLFAQVVPSKVEQYHFYEKEYALQTGVIPKNGPLAGWMESGMISFEYEGTPCIISDYLKMQDPIQVLTSDTEADPDQTHFTDVQLTESFPTDKQRGFYVAMLSDKVVLSEDKTVLDRILADYEIGNTLALSAEKSAEIYGKLPKKVSERYAANEKTYTLTAYKNLLITTQLASETLTDQLVEIKPKAEEQTNRSFSISGTAETLLGNGDMVYCFTADKQVFAYKNKKQLWRGTYEGNLQGQPRLIDLYRNGNQQLLFNTDSKIYLMNNLGGNVNEFPLSLESNAPVNFYRWNNKTYFVLVDKREHLLQLDEQGRTLKNIRLKTGKVSTEVQVYRAGNVLTALVNGDRKLQSVDLDRGKVLKTLQALSPVDFALKESAGYTYFGLQQEALVGTDVAGTKRNIPNASGIKKLKRLYRGDEAFLCAFSKTGVTLIFADGSSKFMEAPVGEIEDVDVLFATNGTCYIAVLDGIENNVYLFNAAGKKMLSESLEGKKLVKLSESAGKITLSTVLQNSMVQYYHLLK